MNATSVSSGSDSARSWNILGHSHGSTATGSLGSHGPMSSDDSRNTRRRLDIFPNPDDEHARSAVLLRFPCEQYHKGITKWINNLCEECDMPADSKHVAIHCKAGSMSVRLVFETRSKCQDFMARYEDDGIAYEIDSPFCSVKTTVTVRQSKSLEDWELVSNLRPCGERWLISSKFSSLMMMKVHLSSQRSTPAHKSSALRIEETGFENLCSNLPLLEADSCLLLLHLTCVFLVFLVKCCNGFSLKPTRPLCDGRSLASPLCRRLAGRGAFFCGFTFRWVLRFVLSLTRCLTEQDTIPCSGENPLYECGRPCDNLSCLFFSALWLLQSQPILVQETWQPKDIDLT